jgi:hypothetical protein
VKFKRVCLVSLSLVLAASALVLLPSNIPNNRLRAGSVKMAPDRVAATSGANASALAQADKTARARAFENYGKLPLSFEANEGQMDSRAKFVSRGPGYTLFLTGNEAVLALKAADKKSAGTSPEAAQQPGKQAMVTGPHTRPATSAVLRMQLLGANREAQIVGSDELSGKSNYFIGMTRRSGAPMFPPTQR